MIHFKNKHPGITLQDLGRTQGRDQGYSKGGALDEISFANANKLLKNPVNTPAIEIIQGGFEAKFEKATTIALTGADLNFELNNQSIHPNKIYKVKVGDVLTSKGPKDGIIAYLATVGGIKAKTYLGSVSIPQREQSLFPIHNEYDYDECTQQLEETKISPLNLNQTELSFYPTYQYSEFATSNLTFKKTSKFNRMGAWINGENINYTGKPLRSEGIAIGSLQVVNPNEVVALFNDCQTIGGFPKLGVLTHTSKCQMAQLIPGTNFKLTPVQT